MAENKNFILALFTSFLIHSLFIFGIPRPPFFLEKKSLNDIVITYYKIIEQPNKEVIGVQKRENLETSISSPKSANKGEELPEIKKEEVVSKPKSSEEVKEEKRIPEGSKEKRFEAVIKEERDEAKKATYINYYRAVREKIKECADKNCPKDMRLGQGEVCLSFIVASSGELLQVQVIDERSVNDRMLREIAINSIRDASPFPPFPHGMSQYQITFNVIIAFEGR